MTWSARYCECSSVYEEPWGCHVRTENILMCWKGEALKRFDMGHFHWNSKPLEGHSATGGKDLWAMDEMEGEGEASLHRLCWWPEIAGEVSVCLSFENRLNTTAWRLTYPRYDFLTMGLSEIRDNLQLLLDTYYFEFRIYMVLICANGTCQTHSCSALSMRPPEPYLNHLSVLFLHIPGPRVVRRCSWRSSGRRPRSWRGWRGARSSRGPRHMGIRGIRGIPMQNNCKEHGIHCDACVSFCLCLFVFVDVSMIDVCRFHMFTLVAPSIDVFGSSISQGAHWCPCDMTKWQPSVW